MAEKKKKNILTNDHYHYINKFRKEKHGKKYNYYVDPDINKGKGVDLHFSPGEMISLENIAHYCNDRFNKHGHSELKKSTISKHIPVFGSEAGAVKIRVKKERVKKERVKKPARTAEQRSASAKEAAKTRKRNAEAKAERLRQELSNFG